MKIPEDLKELHRLAANGTRIENDCELVNALIDRIASLEQQLEQEHQAHNRVASILFAAGIETSDGTSVSAARNAVAELAQAVSSRDAYWKQYQEAVQELAQARAEIARLKDNQVCPTQICGHCASLEVRSVESVAVFCELCAIRAERNDAIEMEAKYKTERDTLRAQLEQMIEIGDRNISYCPEWGAAKNAILAARVRQQEQK